jgi:hypothetical protein
MPLRWERKGLGRYTAYSEEGHQLAQIAHIVGPGGADVGWMVWLTLKQGELFDHYPNAEEAMTAAERALTPG